MSDDNQAQRLTVALLAVLFAFTAAAYVAAMIYIGLLGWFVLTVSIVVAAVVVATRLRRRRSQQRLEE